MRVPLPAARMTAFTGAESREGGEGSEEGILTRKFRFSRYSGVFNPISAGCNLVAEG